MEEKNEGKKNRTTRVRFFS